MNSNDSPLSASRAARQEQFLEVIDRDEAVARFQRHLRLEPLGAERVSLAAALHRRLADDVIATVDVPAFDRSNVDGFAVHAADTFGAAEEDARRLRLNADVISPGIAPQAAVARGTATIIATGGMLPRGADAVVMVEHTDVVDSAGDPLLEVRRAVSPGHAISFAGTDIARGETVLRRSQVLTSREIGVLAAIGIAEVEVFRRPRVAILSTGDEIIPPGSAPQPAAVYDSNAAILAAAVEELGGEPVPLGIVGDDEPQLAAAVKRGLECDVVLMSGGTSKGAGDLSYRVVSRLDQPGIVAHGVALKPGKPICLAVHRGKPVVILPGFPTSAIFTFHEFVAPVLRAYCGESRRSGALGSTSHTVSATLPLRVNSERGRTEFLLVGLVQTGDGLAAYPMGKGSGSVTTFSRADGFITIDRHTEILDAGATVSVQRLGRELEPADLVVIGSHCVGLDYLLGQLSRRGFSTKEIHVGSMGGLAAARRGECDLAGVHLMDPDTGTYNRHLLTPDLEWIEGYRRMQGVVFRRDDPRFSGRSLDDAIRAAVNDADCTMVNRNTGSGTRILIDHLLERHAADIETAPLRPTGYAIQARSHNAVAAAVRQRRADWGVAIDTVAREYGLEFLPLQEEHYDFLIPKSRLDRPPVRALITLLQSPDIRQRLTEMGFRFGEE